MKKIGRNKIDDAEALQLLCLIFLSSTFDSVVECWCEKIATDFVTSTWWHIFTVKRKYVSVCMWTWTSQTVQHKLLNKTSNANKKKRGKPISMQFLVGYGYLCIYLSIYCTEVNGGDENGTNILELALCWHHKLIALIILVVRCHCWLDRTEIIVFISHSWWIRYSKSHLSALCVALFA